MPPHYDRQAETAVQSDAARDAPGSGPDDEAMQHAAEALRQAEVEAVQPDVSSPDPAQLDEMSIDELRAVAKGLDVPDRSTMDELIATIRCCL